jgi:hypothetical protein
VVRDPVPRRHAPQSADGASRDRHLIVTRQSARASTAQSDNTTEPPCAPMTWMARLNRVFDINISVCPNCGGATSCDWRSHRAQDNRAHPRACESTRAP